MRNVFKARVDDLVVGRDEWTYAEGIAGVPVRQLYTHVPLFKRLVRRGATHELDGDLFYDIRNERCRRRNKHSLPHLEAFAKDVTTNGVHTPIPGWQLDTKVAITAGIHRACAAAAAGRRTVPITERTLDHLEGDEYDATGVIKEYKALIARRPGLKGHQTYNPVPGLPSRRKSVDRLRIIYEDLLTIRGRTLLDAGCADGYFGMCLAARAFDVTFVERDPDFIAIINAKRKALGIEAVVASFRIETLISGWPKHWDVVLYTDVFFHCLAEDGLETAMTQLARILSCAKERVIFAPGPWGLLAPGGFTERMMLELIEGKGFRIRYLGQDGGRYREIYALDRWEKR